MLFLFVLFFSAIIKESLVSFIAENKSKSVLFKPTEFCNQIFSVSVNEFDSEVRFFFNSIFAFRENEFFSTLFEKQKFASYVIFSSLSNVSKMLLSEEKRFVVQGAQFYFLYLITLFRFFLSNNAQLSVFFEDFFNEHEINFSLFQAWINDVDSSFNVDVLNDFFRFLIGENNEFFQQIGFFDNGFNSFLFLVYNYFFNSIVLEEKFFKFCFVSSEFCMSSKEDRSHKLFCYNIASIFIKFLNSDLKFFASKNAKFVFDKAIKFENSSDVCSIIIQKRVLSTDFTNKFKPLQQSPLKLVEEEVTQQSPLKLVEEEKESSKGISQQISESAVVERSNRFKPNIGMLHGFSVKESMVDFRDSELLKIKKEIVKNSMDGLYSVDCNSISLDDIVLILNSGFVSSVCPAWTAVDVQRIYITVFKNKLDSFIKDFKRISLFQKGNLPLINNFIKTYRADRETAGSSQREGLIRKDFLENVDFTRETCFDFSFISSEENFFDSAFGSLVFRIFNDCFCVFDHFSNIFRSYISLHDYRLKETSGFLSVIFKSFCDLFKFKSSFSFEKTTIVCRQQFGSSLEEQFSMFDQQQQIFGPPSFDSQSLQFGGNLLLLRERKSEIIDVPFCFLTSFSDLFFFQKDLAKYGTDIDQLLHEYNFDCVIKFLFKNEKFQLFFSNLDQINVFEFICLILLLTNNNDILNQFLSIEEIYGKDFLDFFVYFKDVVLAHLPFNTLTFFVLEKLFEEIHDFLRFSIDVQGIQLEKFYALSVLKFFIKLSEKNYLLK